jgi:hypothetical protein
MKDITMHNYLTRDEILEIYPIKSTAYNRRVKKIDIDPIDKHLTFFYQKKRYTHKSILHKYFYSSRIPNISNTLELKKWMDLIDWGYFCCVTPTSNYIDENITLIKEINKTLKKSFKISKSILYYSIEPFTDSEFYHIHFLMTLDKDIPVEIIKKVIRKIPKVRKEVIYQNRYSSPIFIELYDKEKYNKSGIKYVMKTNILNGILK